MNIIAHRGASAERPENTMAAFRRALEIGVDAIETDVLATRDGRLVLRHDDVVDWHGARHYVGDLAFEEVRQVTVGAGERIPSLEELLAECAASVPVMLDLKSYGTAALLEAALKATLQGSARRSVHITSFLYDEILEAGKRMPDIPRSLVFTSIPVPFEPILSAARVREVSLFRGYLTEPVARRLIDAGIQVRAYPVNWPREAERFSSWGLAGIFTDDPSAMRHLRSVRPPV